jgi:hypothetical protein
VIDHIPALDITVDQLSYKDRALGTVRVAAENRDDGWNARVEMKNDDGTLDASGRWRRSPTLPDTRVDFKFAAKSIEKLLARIGHPDAVRRGNASLAGNLSWNGTPFTIDYPSLGGNLKARRRQRPVRQARTRRRPAAGRAQPAIAAAPDHAGFPRHLQRGLRLRQHRRPVRRRARRDGNEGLADPGPLGEGADERRRSTWARRHRTSRCACNPPWARRSRSVPCSPTRSPAPWSGRRRRYLKDPLDQAFAFEYGVTGSWVDPKVEKLGQQKPAEEGK